MKDNIEKEITEIDKFYDKVCNELETSFEKRHQKLYEEEKNLKENLQNEVTKIKEKLEINLTSSNQIIRENERIMKGIKLLEKEDKNMIKILSYVSKINKNKKVMKQLLSELMKNMKISFQENKNEIIFDYYYFNGIYIPIDIEVSNININSFDLNWKISDLKIKNIEKEKLSYKIEIRKENNNEKFIQIYQGNKMNFNINKLEGNTNYEIRICSLYNDLQSQWSKIVKIKTINIDSVILEESNRKFEFLEKIKEWINYSKLELLYRGSRDGTKPQSFHSKCNKKGATICLYKNEKDYIFGGYNPISWDDEGGWIKNEDSFLFTLTNIHGIEPTKFPHKKGCDSIDNNKDSGPKFDDICLNGDYKSSNACLYFPRGHIDVLNKGKSIFSGYLDNNISNIEIKEIEVFRVIK